MTTPPTSPRPHYRRRRQQSSTNLIASMSGSGRTDSDLSSMIIPEDEQLHHPRERLLAVGGHLQSTSMRSMEAYNSYGHNTIRIIKGKGKTKVIKQSKYPVSLAASKLLCDFSD